MEDIPGIAIRTVDLSKTFRSGPAEVVVFQGLDLEVRTGERVALVGESGAGKSTLLHLLGGLDRPSNGAIYFGPNRISELSDGELADFRNRHIGFVWQSHSLLPEFTALENVMMPLLIRGTSRSDAASAAREKLETVGLGPRITHRAGELSGGEQQRVSLARALVSSPRVLLADEPTGSLDYKTGEGIVTLLEQLHASYHLTSLIVTHNISFARRCDRILILEKGRIVPLTEPAMMETVSTTGTNGSNYV